MCNIGCTVGCETETLVLSRSHEKVICCVKVVQESVHRARLVDIVRALKLHYQSTSGCLFLLSLHRSSPPCLSVDSSGHTRHHLDGMSDGVQTREDREGGLARHLMLSQTIYTLRNSSLRSHWLRDCASIASHCITHTGAFELRSSCRAYHGSNTRRAVRRDHVCLVMKVRLKSFLELQRSLKACLDA